MRWDAHTFLVLLIATVVSACSGGGNDFPESTPATTTPTTTSTPPSTNTSSSPQTTTASNNSSANDEDDDDDDHDADGHAHDEDGNDIRPPRPNRPNRSLSTTVALAPPATAQIVWDTHGQALAIWRAFNGTRNDLWADRFNGVNWTGARLLESSDGDVGNAHIALDATGNVIAAWEQATQGDRAIWAARFDIVRGWQPPNVISRSPDGLRVDAFDARVSANSDTSMTVRWQQIDGQIAGLVTSTNFSRWWENRFTPGLGWSGATLIPTP